MKVCSNSIKFHACVCKRDVDEPIVQNGLSVTPAEMMRLTNEGMSISARNARLLDAVDPADKDFYVPLQYRRGVDVADLANHSADMRQKMRDVLDKYDKGQIADIRKE